MVMSANTVEDTRHFSRERPSQGKMAKADVIISLKLGQITSAFIH